MQMGYKNPPEFLYIDFGRDDIDEKKTKKIIRRTLSIIRRAGQKDTPHIKK